MSDLWLIIASTWPIKCFAWPIKPIYLALLSAVLTWKFKEAYLLTCAYENQANMWQVPYACPRMRSLLSGELKIFICS